MATVGDDCYFFFTSTCNKGNTCQFRHVEAAKSSKIVCQHWQMGGCYRPMCMYRHSDFGPVSVAHVGKTDVFCFWEAQPTGCTKANCTFKHLKPRPSSTSNIPTMSIAPTTNGVSIEAVSTSKFTAPQVTPVVIQPAESEESNSSPIKRPAVGLNHTEVQSEVPKFNLENPTQLNKKPTVIKASGDGVNIKKKKVLKKGSTPSEKPLLKKKVKKVNAKDSTTVKKSPITPTAGKKKIVKKKIVKKTSIKPTDVDNVGSNVKDRLGKVALNVDTVGSNVKDRLGKVASKKGTLMYQQVENNEESSASSSDSDDSIENIKVLSMEEIFRQKALESMIKKRAAAGKELLVSKKPKTVSVVKAKPVNAVKRPLKKVIPASSQPTVIRKVTSVEEQATESSSSSSSASSSSETSSSIDSSEDSSGDGDFEDFEPDVRRVVVDDDTEEMARRRAKASLAKMKKQTKPAKALIHRTKEGKITKQRKVITDQEKLAARLKELDSVNGKKDLKKDRKRVINTDFDTDQTFIIREKKVNVHDRLGAAKRSVIDTSQVKPLLSTLEHSPKKTSDGMFANADEESESELLTGVKVKTLEEIRLEKTKNRTVEVGNDGDESVAELGDAVKSSELAKKPKRRPWRKTQLVLEEELQERNTIEESPPVRKLETLSNENDIDESPFELLKRKALMKKIENTKHLGPASSVQPEDKETVDNNGRKVKKSHKHSKHHKNKKSKNEREIYMPPGMKKTVALVKPTQSSVVEDSEQSQDMVAEAREGQRQKAHKMAAAWMAGLNTSSKGTFKRPEATISSERKEPVSLMDVKLRLGSSSNATNTLSTRLGTSSNASITLSQPASTVSTSFTASALPIKSFSEIMAEKRKRRLEMMAQKESTGSSQISEKVPILASSSVSTIPSKFGFSNNTEKARVPISPILFDKGAATCYPVKESLPKFRRQASPTSSAEGSQNTFSVPPTDTITPNKNKPFSNVARKKLVPKKSSVTKMEDDDILDLDDSSLSIELLDRPVSDPLNRLSQSHLTSTIVASAIDKTADTPKTEPTVPVTHSMSAHTPVTSCVLPNTAKHESPHTIESQVPNKKSRISIDDEFADLLDDDDMETFGNTGAVDEDMDDLLANIDDLLEGD